jgi:hypothetical protein
MQPFVIQAATPDSTRWFVTLATDADEAKAQVEARIGVEPTLTVVDGAETLYMQYNGVAELGTV